MQLKLIEGGFQWQWSEQQEKYFAVHNFAIRPCYYSDLAELEAAVDHAADRMISRRLR